MRFGDIEFDPATRMLSGPDGNVRLGASQSAVMVGLIQSSGVEVSYDRLYGLMFGPLYRPKFPRHMLMRVVVELRRKLSHASLASRIVAARGSGLALLSPTKVAEAADVLAA